MYGNELAITTRTGASLMQADLIAAVPEISDLSASRALPRRSVRYDNIRDFKRDCETSGWQLDCHQIEPGQFEAVLAARRVGDIFVGMKGVDLRVEVLGTPPDDYLTVLSPATGHTVWVNGFRLESSDAMLVQPDARVHIVGGPAVVAVAHIPFRLLVKVGVSDAELDSLTGRDGALLLNEARAAAESLRRLACTCIYLGAAAAGREYELASSVANIIRRARGQQNAGIHRSEAWRTICRAREFIESNLDRPIRMKHVSDYAATSISKLERTFQRELCITPSRYILARRLHAVNLKLESVTSRDAKVSEFAMEYGFNHLGRFSAAYRAQFGELPSQTLQVCPG